MKRPFSIFFVVVLSFLSLYYAYRISYFIGEKYFFDRLFFKKSKVHGYLSPDDGYSFEGVGKNRENIQNFFGREPNLYSNVLGKSTDGPYTIAVIGDSYVWGVGVREDETLSVVLEKKLNEIRKTKVIQLGFPGDSALDNLIKYRLINQEQKIDFFVFVILENDLLFFPEGRYAPSYYQETISRCALLNDQITYNYDQSTPGYDYSKLVKESFENPQNLCLLEKLSSLYPKNAIFFVPQWEGYGTNNAIFKIYTDYLRRGGLSVISVDEARSFPQYQEFWQYPGKFFEVSDAEPHPSKLAHRLFADVLFEEITNNSIWGF